MFGLKDADNNGDDPVFESAEPRIATNVGYRDATGPRLGKEAETSSRYPQ